MVEWESGMPLVAKLSMARRVFNRRVLRIHLSDLDEGQEEPSLGIKDWFCARGMFVIIMSAEICWRTYFVTRPDFMNFMVRGR